MISYGNSNSGRPPSSFPSNYKIPVRQAKPGKGGSDVEAETFRRNPAGSQTRPAKQVGRRKRVLRGAGAIQAAKRRQRVSRAVRMSPESVLAGADAVGMAEGRIEASANQ